ncbi:MULTISPECIES: thiol:disulfide interchange protein DsbA/DsbL [unclassified Oceanobacter]|uniref:thiol:disulfide interchange protein DsbA/DsbL n=2 Tax=Gammaproteobacteria TaxID=1236 RepID=UPI0026E369BC|nr:MULTISPECIES: thiol:disulfide interchange protein DsbA/DsbL [unclassified Oceanobacter]MDO6680700.1 thiol:disulfide interchange protein DsbA/DsbL [Oceanobacter sp. 5_MG-2023]MDP2504469.1 thiol:disulfide interchange protein DsbA/DsbL [Oceanobacter sp. 3_MG-2023]MDP2547077.1 thiol:disulfide interchange protein DsbA/DsbL [Oceanobacter sp. 4_MG-2023]MDP2607901.1 thiol:disulfide interchange protein DsbA/DsbL [Oceanobacter sp. 1_MG-2023]MDP2610915.1 thiol:disulfide interchange protein DsbA/DsbL [
MLSLIKQWIAVPLLLISSLTLAAEYEAGVHYDVLAEPVPVMADGKVHVEEAFWYGCPHCFHLDSFLGKWESTLPADVEFTRVPAMFGRAWVAHAQLFYVADVLGILDQVHTPIFRAINLEKQRLLDKDDQRDFLVKNGGITAAQFDKAYDNFAVKSRMSQGDKRIRSFNISGVPALIVQGKYVVSASTAGGQDKMTSVVDYLVEKERSAK